MDLRRGVPLPEQKDFEMPNSWIPGTPSKPIPLKRLLTTGDGQGNQISGSNWLESMGASAGVHSNRSFQESACQTVGAGSRGSVGRTRDLSGYEAVLASESRFLGHNVDSQANAIRNSMHGWPQIPYEHLLAFKNALVPSNITTSLSPFMFAHMGVGPEQSSSQNQLLLNGKVLLNTNLINRNNILPPTSDYGFRVPFDPNCNINSSSENVAKLVTSQIVMTPLAPVTPDKCKGIQDCRPLSSVCLVDGRENGGNGQEQNGIPPPFAATEEEPIQLCIDQGVSKPADFSSVGFPCQQQENQIQEKKENPGIDLNKTPQQKPRRKKHRPKVVREGKPARTPKTVTPKPASTGENPSGKRKYVRKKGPNTPLETPSSAVQRETVELNVKSGAKSVRRSLKFDAEGGRQATDEHQGATLAFKSNAGFQAEGNCIPCDNISSSSKSTLELRQGLEVVVGNSPAGRVFDLNCSMNQIIDGYLNLPENPTPPPQPSRREVLRENLKDLAMMRDNTHSPSNHESTTPSKMHTGHQLTPESQHASSSASNLPLADEGIRKKGWKRDYNLTVNHAQLHYMNMVWANSDLAQACNEIGGINKCQNDCENHVPCFPEIYKKRRTEKGRNENTFNAASSATYACSEGGEHSQVVHNSFKGKYSFADAQRFMELEKLRAMEGKQAFGQIETTKKRSKAPIQIHNLASLTANVECCNQLRATPKNPESYVKREGTEIICGPQACTEASVADTHAKMRTKRVTKKGQTQAVSSMPSNTNQVGLQESMVAACNLRQQSIGSTAYPTGNFQQKKLQLLRVYPVQDCQSRSNFQETLHADSLSRVLVPYVDPVDVIVQKMKCLNINCGKEKDTIQAQSALVRYDGPGMMVPLEGKFDHTKKRRPRPKVDLDLETNRVWKLLMGKEGTDAVEGTDVDKEKWWEEERQVFRGRADSFIARMHLIQGDRRFSQWKGSVVDSVVGVFLTQNVSDHLSSSAFMALAARFPPQSRGNNKEPNAEKVCTSTEQQVACILNLDATEKILDQQVCDQGSTFLHEAEHMEGKEISCSNESLGRNMGGGICSSQNSVVSSQNSSDYPVQAVDRIGSSSESNSEAEDLITGNKCNDLDSSTSFMELLHMSGTSMFQEFFTHGNGSGSEEENCNSQIHNSVFVDVEKRKSSLDELDKLSDACPSTCTSISHLCHTDHDFTSVSCAPFTAYHSHNSPNSRFVEVENIEALREERILFLPSINSGIANTNGLKFLNGDSNAPTSNLPVQRLPCSRTESCPEMHSYQQDSNYRVTTEALPNSNNFRNCSELKDEHVAKIRLKEREADFQVESAQSASEALGQMRDCRMHQSRSGLPYHKETLDVVECSSMVGKGIADKAVESNPKDEICSSGKVPLETASNVLRTKRGKVETEKKKTFDWDSLRRQACCSSTKKERSINTTDSLDWEAVRSADVREISNAIRERGMNNMLAERIQDFLNRLVREHGSIDLEWLRDIPPDKTKDYLLSIRGLGLKSVECVRLLTLHHLAFPVDTNVGRICVRLGWVPLQPLPESLQLHLLELYPMLETIQKYLWPRLCTLDQRTLYELHYQMITFGKVFCTKSKPNCNACPMRGECRHFASAFASARLALPGPEEKSVVTSTIPISTQQHLKTIINPMLLPQLEGIEENPLSHEVHAIKKCEPIIEEPATPEPECIEISEGAIEDDFYEDPDEIPMIKLNFEEFTQNLQNYMQENNMELQDGEMSKALVALTPEAASIPTPKLKNVSRLRTEHQVYELPDSHPLVEGLDQRETDDPCPYLLAIWTPGETPQSTEPPEICCSAQDTGKLCDKNTCFSCNSIREAQAQKVRGTLLIPCRTAMRGSFPLNGTYFQVNEVFADHDSSLNPIDVPRAWIWNLPRRTVCFGTSVTTIFRGLTTEGIQHCFWRGFVCVRGFDQKTRAPRPLIARLHFPASKITRNKKSATKDDGKTMQEAADNKKT